MEQRQARILRLAFLLGAIADAGALVPMLVPRMGGARPRATASRSEDSCRSFLKARQLRVYEAPMTAPVLTREVRRRGSPDSLMQSWPIVREGWILHQHQETRAWLEEASYMRGR
jgi:hypothetical protein